MIIDTHTHFYDPSRPQGVPWPGPDGGQLYRTVLPEHYRALAEPEGVTGTVVVEASAWLDDNQWILDLAEIDPFIVGLVGHIDPSRDAFADELARYADHPRFCGIRCGSGYFNAAPDGEFLRDMELLASRDLALDVLLGTDQFAALETLAESLPRLRIVINHTGHVAIDGLAPDDAWKAGIERLSQHANVYMKVSAVMEQSTQQPAPTEDAFYAPALEAMWQVFGAERLIYGSNWPVCERAGSFADAFAIVRRFFDGKGANAAQRYFGENARAVYRWG